jgi:hypothetical protein
MKPIWIILPGLLLAIPWGLQAQEDSNPFYINVSEAQPNKVYEILTDLLALEYHDYTGASKEMALSVYDWHRVLKGQVKLSKSFGLNTFKINLSKLGGDWEFDQVYTLVFTEGNNRLKEIFVKRLTRDNLTPPTVDILVNPIQFKCEGLLPNLVDYYGVISGGRAPYQIQWFVLNGQRTDFLFQPREEKIEAAGKTMVVSVDKSPEYYVLLYVTDACGNQGKKMLQVTCNTPTKNISTIFVEPLNKPLYNQGKPNGN